MTVPSTYRRQFSHERQRPNSTLNLFNLYKRSVFPVLAGFVSPVHLSSLPNPFLGRKKKFSHFVTAAGDWIVPTSLLETFLMMCRSTSALSLIVWIEFFHNCWMPLTVGLACMLRDSMSRKNSSIVERLGGSQGAEYFGKPGHKLSHNSLNYIFTVKPQDTRLREDTWVLELSTRVLMIVLIILSTTVQTRIRVIGYQK